MIIDFRRKALLFDFPLIEQNDPIGEVKGLTLVMSHVDAGDPGLFVEAVNLLPHFFPQAGVDIRQGFIQKQQLRVGG